MSEVEKNCVEHETMFGQLVVDLIEMEQGIDDETPLRVQIMQRARALQRAHGKKNGMLIFVVTPYLRRWFEYEFVVPRMGDIAVTALGVLASHESSEADREAAIRALEFAVLTECRADGDQCDDDGLEVPEAAEEEVEAVCRQKSPRRSKTKK